MCYTTLMTKKEPLQLEILPFFSHLRAAVFFQPEILNSKAVHCDSVCNCAVFSEVSARAVDLDYVQKYIKDVNSI